MGEGIKRTRGKSGEKVTELDDLELGMTTQRIENLTDDIFVLSWVRV